MFGKKQKVIYITKNKIIIFRIKLGKSPQKRIIAQIDWTPEIILSVLKKVRKVVGHSGVVLLDEDLSYLTTISVSSDANTTPSLVKTKTQEVIPEALNNTLWTYKETPFQITVKGRKEKLIQVYTLTSRFYGSFAKSLITIKLNFNSIQTVSYVIAQQFRNEKKPVLAIYYSVGVLVYQGVVFSTTKIATPLTNDTLNHIIHFNQKYFQTVPGKVVIDGTIPNLNIEEFKKKSIIIEQGRIDPLLIFAKIISEEKEHQESFELQLSSTPNSTKARVYHDEDLDDDTSLKSNNIKAILVILFFIMITMINALIFFQRSNSKKESTTVTPTITRETSSTPLPTQTEKQIATGSATVDLTKYSVTVLNGSGQAGKAAELQEVLTTAGFSVPEIGNSENIVDETVVQYKESVEEVFKTELIKILEETYTITDGPTLLDSDTSDVLITVGSL